MTALDVILSERGIEMELRKIIAAAAAAGDGRAHGRSVGALGDDDSVAARAAAAAPTLVRLVRRAQRRLDAPPTSVRWILCDFLKKSLQCVVINVYSYMISFNPQLH